ncbi:protein EMBRYO DEFECTIVE 514-like [Nicotiana tomentosiformis]|uniref:protein EMBRYO DEFECTIVE 514-like n=1 Tax=Nicotiana tomentosiformis TaxID=4098 RepID=UPI00051B0BB1|nr:protein EMBRYO DEFECTIVE 514-like [Nicotiana tomentosiformis]
MAETEPEVAAAPAAEAVAQAEKEETPAQDMDVEAQTADDAAENGSSKRPREEEKNEPENEDATKKLKVDKSVEEQRLENLDGSETAVDEEKKNGSGPASVGSKNFWSSVEMFDYFYKLLHSWSPNLNLNKYEHLVLLDLLKKGHLEPDRKIGTGIRAFQIRFHPQFKSRCFFVIREDGSVDDFSFRKCVDHILPLPENMQVKHEANKALAHSGKRGGRKGGGHGGKSRY